MNTQQLLNNPPIGRRMLLPVVLGIGFAVWSLTIGVSGTRAAGSDHVRWDIIHLGFTSPLTISAGGSADATASNPSTLRIRLTGSGTFVAPASGGTSGAVTGGGTWETFNGAVSTGSGTYWVTGLSSWEFDNFQTGPIIDLIGNANDRANGNAVLRIHYSDGSDGTLGIGCHGPGASPGIVEGVIATKNFVTYWNAAPPAPGVDLNRTVFHVTK